MDKHTRIRSVDDLGAYYRSINHNNELAVGLEWERSGVFRDTLEPVQALGEKSYSAVLRKLVEEVGWEITEGNSTYIASLKRGNTSITTEGDGRLELAGSPDIDLHNLAREFRLHTNEVREMGNVFNIGWLPLGWQPFHRDDEIQLLPKARYKIFMELDQTGKLPGYLKKCNGIHINVSYTDEVNAVKKAQTAFRLTPIVGALFASSAFDQGQPNGYHNYRRYINGQFFPDRTKTPEHFLEEDFQFSDWIESYLSIPVVFIKQPDGTDVSPDNLTFRDWMENGYEGRYPTLHDFDQHVKTYWGDLRLRPGYLEYRAIDSVPFRMVMSVTAFMKGLLFDREGWEAVEKLTRHWTYEDIIHLDRQAQQHGLQAEVNNKTLLWYAQELVLVANEMLHKFARTNEQGEDESVFLIPLKEQIYIKEKSLSEEMLELWHGEWDQNPRRILEFCEKE